MPDHQYTPTTDEVCQKFASMAFTNGLAATEAYERFHRWLAAHDANVLRKAAYEWSRAGNDANVYAWLHYRADQINPPRCDQIEVDND